MQNTVEGFIALSVGVLVLLFYRPLVRVYMFFFQGILTSRPLAMSKRGAERFTAVTLFLVGAMAIVTGIGLLIAGD